MLFEFAAVCYLTAAALAQGLDAAAATSIITAFDQLDPTYPVIICGSLYLAGHVLLQNKTLPDYDSMLHLIY